MSSLESETECFVAQKADFGAPGSDMTSRSFNNVPASSQHKKVKALRHFHFEPSKMSTSFFYFYKCRVQS